MGSGGVWSFSLWALLDKTTHRPIADRLLNLTKGLNEVDVCRSCGECNQRWWCSYMKSISPPLCCECFPGGTGPDRRNINGESFIYGPPTDRWDRMERLLLEMVDLLARLKEIYGSGAFLVISHSQVLASMRDLVLAGAQPSSPY